MSKTTHIAHLALGMSLLAMGAGAGTLPQFALAAQTTHFSFYSRGAKVDAEKSERYLAALATELGTSFEGHASYYRYDNAEQMALATGSYGEGVTFPQAREIHSTEAFQAHEIVHLVVSQMGDPGVFFQEGLAVALGNEGRWNGSDVDKLAKKVARGEAWRTLMDRFDSVDAQQSYPAAGSFVRSLIKQYGMAKVAAFVKACSRPQQRDAAFEHTFGVTIAQAATQWEAAL